MSLCLFYPLCFLFSRNPNYRLWCRPSDEFPEQGNMHLTISTHEILKSYNIFDFCFILITLFLLMFSRFQDLKADWPERVVDWPLFKFAGFFLSVFFSKAKLAAIVAPFVHFGAIMPRYIFFRASDGQAISGKSIAALLPPTAFTFGTFRNILKEEP